jgi:polar amino acid transport system substrate-binding protein
MKRWLAGLTMVLMLVFSGQLWADESVIESIQQKGVIRVGMSTFVPWAMRDKTGELMGFEVDVARKLAEDMGVKVEFVPTNWSGIIPALLTGKFDVIIGGMGITPQRNLKVNFSEPYDFTGMSLVAHRKKAGGFSTLSDFNKKEVSIAVRIGTTAAMAAKKYLPEATFKLFENESQALQELYLGRVHAVVSSAPLPAFQALKFPEKLFVPLNEPFTQEPIGFAVKKGDFDALNYFNNWIRVKQAEGFLAETKHYWFETRDWAERLK